MLDPITLKLIIRKIIDSFANEWITKLGANTSIQVLLYRIECLIKLLNLGNIDDIFDGDNLITIDNMDETNIFNEIDIYAKLAVIGCKDTLYFIFRVTKDKDASIVTKLLRMVDIASRYHNTETVNMLNNFLDEIDEDNHNDISYFNMFFNCIPTLNIFNYC
jgi:hypothetical protein